jgi:hypothetical protein
LRTSGTNSAILFWTLLTSEYEARNVSRGEGPSDVSNLAALVVSSFAPRVVAVFTRRIAKCHAEPGVWCE